MVQCSLKQSNSSDRVRSRTLRIHLESVSMVREACLRKVHTIFYNPCLVDDMFVGLENVFRGP